ncbi:hypothetical protein [Argonema antarcticum]|uniref:hypothetical protein n=1 Tax=Argonema antarcticum TaxID=2942763 RepID=UPI0020116FBE|nr:hypothetical protein [Argonema antarcticum]
MSCTSAKSKIPFWTRAYIRLCQAEAQRLLRENLTPQILQKHAIEKWDGKFPTVMSGNGALPFINVSPANLPTQQNK